MTLLHRDSLAATVDAVNDVFFFDQTYEKSDAQGVVKWLTGRQGLAGSYCNMFAPTEKDYAQGIRMFTGERITTRAATGHILGEETCRILILLTKTGVEADDSLSRASISMDRCLTNSERELGGSGFF